MKKKVIFYCGYSMTPPKIVELLNNNKGKVLSYSEEIVVDIPDHKIRAKNYLDSASKQANVYLAICKN